MYTRARAHTHTHTHTHTTRVAHAQLHTQGSCNLKAVLLREIFFFINAILVLH
jgi:hypothetical protein